MYEFLCSKKAFTIVELIISVAIIAILVVVAVPLIPHMLERERKKDCNSQIKIIEANVQIVMSGMEDNGKPIEVMGLSEGVLIGSGSAKHWVLSSGIFPYHRQHEMGADKRADSQQAKPLPTILKSPLLTQHFFLLFSLTPRFPYVRLMIRVLPGTEYMRTALSNATV
ncbi:MAG: type II secretion system protein [Acutalibacteraceae bacterium]